LVYAGEGPARTAALRGQRPYAGSGRALPCTRDFFEKKSSKNFLPAAAGMGAVRGVCAVGAFGPARQKDGGRGGEVRDILVEL